MRISDWSSDVCSSDLVRVRNDREGAAAGGFGGNVRHGESASWRDGDAGRMRIIRVAAARAGMVAPVLIKRTWRLVTGFAATCWVPARAAGLRGECPPATALGQRPLLYFAPQPSPPPRHAGTPACRTPRYVGRQARREQWGAD